jgi:predicted transcriptional regulator
MAWFTFFAVIFIAGFLSQTGNRSSSSIKISEEKVEVYEYINPLNSNEKAKDLSVSSTVKIEPPETFFSIPRKIDWDELNKTRKYHGELGEMFVYDLEKNYLTKIGRSDLAGRVEHVSKEGDGHGYDIKSFNENGTEKFIEVKATNASSGSTFNISKNEFNFLQTHLSNAVLYHVHNVNNKHETTVIVYSASAVVNSPDISPSGYVVKM